jgi:hypothetical protein
MCATTQGGLFDRLPYELRLQIWENALSDGSTNIMRTSHGINEEISERLYDTLDIHLSPIYDDPWIRVSCRRMHLNWTIKSPTEKNKHTPNPDKCCRDIYDGLLPLPFEKLKLVINIYAPDHRDGAQLLLLWQKVRALVAILNQTPGSKSVEVALRQHGEHTWYWASKVTAGLTTRLADSDLLLVPFGKLARLRDFSMTPSTLVMRQHKDIDALITDIDFYFDTELDSLRGRAAAMLRLERFATWFSSSWGKLPYEDQTLTTIRRHHGAVATYDSELTKLRLRYNCFDTAQLSAFGKDLYHPIDHDFDWQKWLKAYPKGIPRLSKEWLREKRRKTYRRLRLRQYSANNIADPRQLTQFWYSVANYLARVWNSVSFPNMPRMFSEARWCEECRQIGFRVGCDDCRGLNDFDEDGVSEVMTSDESGDMCGGKSNESGFR